MSSDGLKSSNSVMTFDGVFCELSSSNSWVGDSRCSTSPLNIKFSSAAGSVKSLYDKENA